MNVVTRYALTVAPLLVGVFHGTVARPTPGTTVGLPGASGTPIRTGAERADNGLHPSGSSPRR